MAVVEPTWRRRRRRREPSERRAIYCFVAAAVCGLGCREREATTPLQAPVLAQGSNAAQVESVYGRVGPDFSARVTALAPSIVAIHNATLVKDGPASLYPASAGGQGADGQASTALGSGVAVLLAGRPYVVTTAEVARTAALPKVLTASGQSFEAQVIGTDARLGIALLAIAPDQQAAATAPPLPTAPLGQSRRVRVGEWIAVVGNPFGDGPMATVGVVSSLGSAPGSTAVLGVPATATSSQLAASIGFRSHFVVDAKIHAGVAGGAVIDTAGAVIGLATLPTGTHGGNSLNFVVPIDRISEVLEALRTHGTVARSWLGALVKPVPKDTADAAGISESDGALVTEIKQASPASKSSLRVGDVVLTWNGTKVNVRELPYTVAAAVANKPVTLGVWRDRAVVEVVVTPEAMQQ